MTNDAPQSTSLKVPLHPALLLAISSCLAFGIRHLSPDPLGLRPDPRSALLGISFLGALLILAWSFWTYRRRGTSPEYGHDVRALLTTGPYRFSRNPLFLANTLLFLALVLELDCAWNLALVPLHLLALDRLVVRREERFLASRFGDPYLEYCRRVPRWLFGVGPGTTGGHAP